MKILQFTLLMFLSLQGYTQEDSLDLKIQQYQRALSMLTQMEQSQPQDSLAIAQERQRLCADYKRVSDSLQQHADIITAVLFELQRRIDHVNYRHSDTPVQTLLDSLYSHAAQHPDIIIEANAPLNKIAQCIIGVKPEDTTNETQIIQYNARRIQDFYKHLDTIDWTNAQRQRFIDFFAGQYINIGSVRKTEKLYRHFDSLFVPETTNNDLKNFSLPDSLRFQNGTMALTPQNWSTLPKNKIVVQLAGQNLFDFVYLVSLLRTVHRNYASDYDVVLLRSTYEEHQAYLSNVKRNLDFANYYIATANIEAIESVTPLPRVFVINAKNEVTDQAPHTNSLFKKLNAPVEAAKALADEERLAELAQRKEALKQRAIRTKDSINYKASHGNITFTLKGVWEENLSTRLTRVQWEEDDTIVDTTKPYMAKFEVMHPKYKVYELLVLVTGKKQGITITSGNNYEKFVTYEKEKNARFHKAIEAIDKSLSQQTTYAYLLNNYPFQRTAFMTYVAEQFKTAENQEQEAISSLKEATKLLRRYAELKPKQVRTMM